MTEPAGGDTENSFEEGTAGTPSLSADGSLVVLRSNASNLAAGDTNGADDVFVIVLRTASIERVSVDSSANQGNAASGEPSVSGGGRFVAFGRTLPTWCPGTSMAPVMSSCVTGRRGKCAA